MLFVTPYHYTFSTGGFGITLNALGTDSVGRNYTQCYTVAGAKLYVYVDDTAEDIHIYHKKDFGTVDGESDAIKANHYAAAYDILCYPTHFTTDAKLYVYAAIPRSEEAEQVAIIVYPPQRIDILGRVEEVNEAGEKVERQLGDPDYYYIDLQGRITSAIDGPREWEQEIMQGAILGHIIGDEAAITRGNQMVTVEMMSAKIEELKKYIDAMNFFELYSLGKTKAYVVDPETGEFALDDDGQKIPVQVQAKDDDGNLLYKDADGHTTTNPDGNEPFMTDKLVERESVKLKDKYEGLWAQGWISALGINPRTLGGRGQCDIDIIDDEDYEDWMDGAAFDDDDIIDDDGGGGAGTGGGVSYLSKLKDVVLTGLTAGDILVYEMTGNGGLWVNKKNTGGSLSKGDLLGNLWGNDFHVGDRITGNIKLAEDKYITFGASGEKIYCIEDDPNILVITAPLKINGGALIEWDNTRKAYHFHGAIYSDSWISALGANSDASSGGGGGGGGGTDVSWGNYYEKDNVKIARYLSVGEDDDMELVVLQSALENYKPTVDWSNVPSTLNTKANTAGTADNIKTGASLGTLWGNAFKSGDALNDTIKLGSGKYIKFNNNDAEWIKFVENSGDLYHHFSHNMYISGNYMSFENVLSKINFGKSGGDRWMIGPNARVAGDKYSSNMLRMVYNTDTYMVLGEYTEDDKTSKTVILPSNIHLRIGDGDISWDATNKALKFTSAIWSESWISALGANSATIKELEVNNIKVNGSTTTKTLTVGTSTYAGGITLKSGIAGVADQTIASEDGKLKLSANEVAISVQTLSVGGTSITAAKWKKLVEFANTL